MIWIWLPTIDIDCNLQLTEASLLTFRKLSQAVTGSIDLSLGVKAGSDNKSGH